MFSNQRAIFQLYSGREHLIWMESPCIFNLSVLHIWFKTWMESPCMFNLYGSKLLDGIFLYVQFVSTSCLGQNFYIESHCMFNLSVLYVWFKTFECNHPVCSTCQYFMSGSKPLDVITLYVQLVSTSCLVQNFWIEPPCMFNLSVLHVWLKTFGWIHPVCSTCQFFMPGSKLLNGITLYVQIVWFKTFGWKYPVCSTCLLHVWFKKFGWNHPVCSNFLFFMSGSKLLDGNTMYMYVQLVFFMSGSKLLDWTTLYLQIVSISCLVQHCWLIFARPKIFVLKSNKRNICRKKSLVFSVCKVSN